jgi:ATP-binding cassette subfamily B protein
MTSTTPSKSRGSAASDGSWQSLSGTREILGAMAWVWRRAWQAGPARIVGVVMVTLARGVVPAGAALVVRGLVNSVSAGAGSTEIFAWLTAGFVVASTEALGRFLNTYFMERLGDELHIRMTGDLMSHAGSLDVSFFEDPRQRDVIQRTQQATGPRLAWLVSESVAMVLGLIQAATVLAVLVAIEPLVVLVVPPFAIPFLLFQWRLARQRYREEHQRATRRRWTNYYMSLMTGAYSVAEVRLLDVGPLLVQRFRALMAEFRDRDRRLHRQNLIGSSLAASLTLAALYVLFARVALRGLQGAATLGDLAIFAGAAGMLRSALDQTIRSASTALEETLFAANLIEFLSARPALRFGSASGPRAQAAAVSIRNVSFGYPGSSRPVLNNLSLEVRPGETLAIVGENGAGKSTLAKLIARLYDPDGGQILLDGVDLRELAAGELHRRIGFVFQSFGCYEGTAAENIAFGDWRTLLDDPKRIEDVARAAKIDGLIRKLPDGYDTVVGREFGKVTLSSGQWQQLAMARACARSSSLLILDEPTSSLDPRAEYDLFLRFKQLAAGRTTILISHRFTTIGMADRIAVLDGGEVVELGTHEELLARSGPYAAMFALRSQSLRPTPSA